jgi:hypothetical protein
MTAFQSHGSSSGFFPEVCLLFVFLNLSAGHAQHVAGTVNGFVDASLQPGSDL